MRMPSILRPSFRSFPRKPPHYGNGSVRRGVKGPASGWQSTRLRLRLPPPHQSNPKADHTAAQDKAREDECDPIAVQYAAEHAQEKEGPKRDDGDPKDLPENSRETPAPLLRPSLSARFGMPAMAAPITAPPMLAPPPDTSVVDYPNDGLRRLPAQAESRSEQA